MKKMIRFFSMAVLFAAVATLTGCEKEFGESGIYTATVKMADGGKALDASGHKTFAEGEQIAVIYKNTSGATVKAVSAALTAGDITASGKKASFSVSLTNPDMSKNVTYIYPAAMARDNGAPNYAALQTQDGTLATLSSDLDYCSYSGAWDGTNLPAKVTLTNQLAVCKFTIKNFANTDITSSITSFIVDFGGYSYTVSRSAVAGPIYLALLPVSGVNISFTASNDAVTYLGSATGKTLAAGHMYPIELTMVVPFSVSSTKQIVFSRGNLQYVSSTWQFAAHQYDCLGESQSDGNRDTFGWGTGNNPNQTANNSSYYPTFNEWGANAIGGNTGWRTPTKDEWVYLLNTDGSSGRSDAYRFAKGKIHNKKGLLIFPDGFNPTAVGVTITNANTPSASHTTYTDAQWTLLEASGTVFLPEAGTRVGTGVIAYNGYYWSATQKDESTAFLLYFSSASLNPAEGTFRQYGAAVRLVRDVN